MVRIIVACFLAFTVALLPSAAKNTDAPEKFGPEVGKPLAIDIRLLDQTGTLQSLPDLAGEKGTVLVFFRSADWCPYCRAQLIDLQQNAYDMIKDKGYHLVAVSYDPVATLKKFSDKFSIPFPLLSDEGSKVIDALKIRNPAYKGMRRFDGVPYPLVIILDKDGIVKATLHEASYKKRPKTSTILAALD